MEKWQAIRKIMDLAPGSSVEQKEEMIRNVFFKIKLDEKEILLHYRLTKKGFFPAKPSQVFYQKGNELLTDFIFEKEIFEKAKKVGITLYQKMDLAHKMEVRLYHLCAEKFLSLEKKGYLPAPEDVDFFDLNEKRILRDILFPKKEKEDFLFSELSSLLWKESQEEIAFSYFYEGDAVLKDLLLSFEKNTLPRFEKAYLLWKMEKDLLNKIKKNRPIGKIENPKKLFLIAERITRLQESSIGEVTVYIKQGKKENSFKYNRERIIPHLKDCLLGEDKTSFLPAKISVPDRKKLEQAGLDVSNILVSHIDRLEYRSKTVFSWKEA